MTAHTLMSAGLAGVLMLGCFCLGFLLGTIWAGRKRDDFDESEAVRRWREGKSQ